MKLVLIITMALVSFQSFAQSHGQGKAVNEVLPKSVQAHDAIMGKKKKAQKEVAPCDSKEDILKKLEAEKKAQAEAGKGLSLQGKTDAGCTVK